MLAGARGSGQSRLDMMERASTVSRLGGFGIVVWFPGVRRFVTLEFLDFRVLGFSSSRPIERSNFSGVSVIQCLHLEIWTFPNVEILDIPRFQFRRRPSSF